ncbi:hypothetical protein LZL87_012731 [Fusarium oxysporum]|nr:hypothetical protein LZL87_012731 [Fusarium oxysporum]
MGCSFAVGIPRSGGPIDDKCALDALSTVEVAGHELLAWRLYCEEALPLMDHAELKKRLKQQEIEELRLCMRRSNEVQRLRKTASRSADQLQRSRRTVLENVKELSFLHNKVKGWEVAYSLGKKDQHLAELFEGLHNRMSLSAEKRRSKYLELKVAMLERKLDLADALRESDQLHECYNNEDASNGQSKRLLEIASERKDGYEEIEKANMAIFEAEEKMEAAEQNFMQ